MSDGTELPVFRAIIEFLAEKVALPSVFIPAPLVDTPRLNATVELFRIKAALKIHIPAP